MPSQAEAFRFVSDPDTPVESLRRACEILDLDTAGSVNVLRVRLIDHLRSLDPIEPVVCLNPRTVGAKQGPAE